VKVGLKTPEPNPGNPLHILHVSPYYAPAFAYGGVVSAVTGLATAQAECGHRVTVLTTDALTRSQRNPVPRETIAGVEVIRCRNVSSLLRARLNLSFPRGFRAVFAELARRADVVHVHELRTVENVLIDHARPIILSAHGTLSYETGRGAFKRAWDAVFGRAVLRKFDHIAALTANEADQARTLWATLGLAAQFPGASIIPNGVPADFSVEGVGTLRVRYALGDGPVVLFLGRLHERKGLQFLIPAFAQVTADPELSSARLLVVGPDEGMLAQAQTLTAEAGIAGRVTFTGLLRDADQRAALATADIFALPAIGEGLPMSTLEAMAAGIPLILTPGCNLPDVEKRDAGLLVPREVGPLADALRVLLRDPGRRKTMGENGRAWVQESFTWQVIAAQTEMMYRLVLQKQTSPDHVSGI